MQNTLNDFLIPSDVKVTSTDANHLRIVLEPLARGMGHTLGNPLRRILLAFMPGAAVTSMQIEGVPHEFTKCKGTRQDPVDIMLNLKDVACILPHGQTAEMFVDVKGPCVIKAGDFELTQGLQIVNPDLEIVEVTEATNFVMRAQVTTGMGYVPADALPREEYQQVGVIGIDASYSPVHKVAYKVEDVRVENRTDLDRLVLDVVTNGTLDAQEAIQRAATILSHQLSAFTNVSVAAAAAHDESGPVSDVLFAQPVDTLDLTVRAANCLKGENLRYIGELVQRSKQDLLRTPNLGRKSLSEIEAALANVGLTLGMTIDAGWEQQVGAPRDDERFF